MYVFHEFCEVCCHHILARKLSLDRNNGFVGGWEADGEEEEEEEEEEGKEGKEGSEREELKEGKIGRSERERRRRRCSGLIHCFDASTD